MTGATETAKPDGLPSLLGETLLRFLKGLLSATVGVGLLAIVPIVLLYVYFPAGVGYALLALLAGVFGSAAMHATRPEAVPDFENKTVHLRAFVGLLVIFTAGFTVMASFAAGIGYLFQTAGLPVVAVIAAMAVPTVDDKLTDIHPLASPITAVMLVVANIFYYLGMFDEPGRDSATSIAKHRRGGLLF